MIRLIIKLYVLLIMIDAICSFFPELSKHEWRRKLKKICDYSLNPVRKLLPHHLPFDFSPMIVVLGLYIFIELFGFLW